MMFLLLREIIAQVHGRGGGTHFRNCKAYIEGLLMENPKERDREGEGGGGGDSSFTSQVSVVR